MSGGVKYNDRALVLGMTGSGKSELLNFLFSSMRSQRVLIDTKDEWTIPGVPRSTDVAEIDWQAPVIHFVSERADVSDFDALFERAYYQRGPMTIAVHELGDLCDFQPNRTPQHFKRYLSMGRAKGLGLLGASQRPVEMPSRARTECEHVFAVVPRISASDTQVIAGTMNREPRQLEADLDELHAAHGRHSFLWFDRGAQSLTAHKPLGPEQRRGLVRLQEGP